MYQGSWDDGSSSSSSANDFAGYAPPAPVDPFAPTASERMTARISAQKWNDFAERYIPLEGQMRNATGALNSDYAYQRAMAKAGNTAVTQAGAALQAGLLKQAGGGSAVGTQSALLNAGGMLGKTVPAAMVAQRNNYFAQGTKVAGVGSGISGAGMDSFKSIADTGTTNANQAYANSVASDLAGQSSMLASLNGLSAAGLQYQRYNTPQQVQIVPPSNPYAFSTNTPSFGSVNLSGYQNTLYPQGGY